MYVFRKIGLLAFFEYLMHVALLQYKRTYSTSILFVFILLHWIDFIQSLMHVALLHYMRTSSIKIL